MRLRCAVETRKPGFPPTIDLVKKDKAPTFDEIWEEGMARRIH